jgi:hypothetical protein
MFCKNNSLFLKWKCDFLDPKFLFWPYCTLQLVKPSCEFSSKCGGVQNWLKWSLLIWNFSSSDALKVCRVPLFTNSLSTECKAFKTTSSKGSLHVLVTGFSLFPG